VLPTKDTVSRKDYVADEVKQSSSTSGDVYANCAKVLTGNLKSTIKMKPKIILSLLDGSVKKGNILGSSSKYVIFLDKNGSYEVVENKDIWNIHVLK
jgi:hypothetical protein